MIFTNMRSQSIDHFFLLNTLDIVQKSSENKKRNSLSPTSPEAVGTDQLRDSELHNNCPFFIPTR